jgi:hypothetical protein
MKANRLELDLKKAYRDLESIRPYLNRNQYERLRVQLSRAEKLLNCAKEMESLSRSPHHSHENEPQATIE